MQCDTCGSDLKALFNSLYCPNEDNHGNLPWREVEPGVWVTDHKRGEAFACVKSAPTGYHAFIEQILDHCRLCYLFDGFQDPEAAKKRCEDRWGAALERFEDSRFPYVG